MKSTAKFRTAFRALLILIVTLAVASCGATVKKKKEEADIHYRMGVVHLSERNYADALKELTTATETYPEEPSYHNALGLAYFARGMNREAVKEMKAAIDLDRNFSEAHVNLAAVYIVDKQWDMAIGESREALKNIFYRTPEFAYFNMGQAYFNKGDFKGAADNFIKAVNLKPNYAQAYYNLGLAFERTGDYKAASDAYDKAVKSAPDYLDAYFSLGMALVRLKDKAGAVKAFEKVMEIAPESDKALSARDYINLLK